MKKLNNSKIQRLLIFFVVGILVIVLASTIFLTAKNNRELRTILDESVKSNLISISVAAREILDIDKFDSYSSKEDIDGDIEDYNRTREKLLSLREKVGATYIYALKEISGKYYFIFDTDTNPYPNNPDKNDTIFDEYKGISEVHVTAFSGKESAGIMNVVDEWGSFNTGAVPVWKGDRIVGIISADIEDKFIRSSDKTAATNIYILIMTLAVVMGINILIIRRLVVKPIRMLTHSISKADDASTIYGIERNDEFGILARTILEMLSHIESRDKLLTIINKATTLLLQADVDQFNETLQISMGMMAEAVEVDRIYIWKNHSIDGRLYCTQLCEWSEGAAPQQGNEYTTAISYDENMPEWEDLFMRHQCVNSLVRNLSEEEQAQLVPQGIISILVVPVYLKDEFWGFVGFDDCHKERLFTESEESILRAGSLLIANALLRNAMTQELESALEKAQAASVAKGNFLSNMSHEIRTPINAIIGMTSIGKAAPEMGKKDYAFDRVASASIHLLGVINDILDISKIESGRFELSVTEFDFEKMLVRVVNVSSFRVEEKEQRLTVYVDRNIPQFMIGDDQRLAQVITNILGNAVKFTQGKGTINLHTYLLGEENGICEIKIVIADSGIGISPEQQVKLFQPFQQAESSTSRKFGGTGLGLAISKSIVEMMGGRIWVESEFGKGATFSFTVKIQRSEIKAQEFSQAIDWKNIRVLAVDDDMDILQDFQGIMERFGALCDIAANGNDALELLKDNEYTLFFVDWRMPGMDGVELTMELKKRLAKKSNSFVIMVSAAETSVIAEKAKEAGVDRLMQKPLFPSMIADIVREYLGAPESEKAEVNSSIKGIFAGRRVLLAEDVEINREIVMELLKPTSLQIECAENGREAVHKFAEAPEKYEMIFMDLQMPEMDGLEATRRIRALDLQKAKSIPIVAMTANVFKEDVENCLAAGMNAHIGKPLDLDIVLEKLRTYLN